MTDVKSLWGARELAVRLGTTRQTINTMRWRIGRGLVSVDRLPPPLAVDGHPRWDPEIVEEWIHAKSSASRQKSSVNERKTRSGRKRLVDVPPIRLY